MRQTLGSIGVVVLLAAVSGCEVTQNIVRIEVNFDGDPSCFAAGVDSVRVTFPDTLAAPRVVPCDSENGVAVEFQDLEPSTYRVTVDAANGTSTLWGAREQIVVTGGKQTFQIDLQSVLPSALASFKFAAPSDTATGMTCAQAEVQTVQVSVDNRTPVSVNCHNSSTGTDVALIEGLSEGSHDFRFFVTDSQGRTTYEMTTRQPVSGDSANSFNINLKPKLKGSVQLQWTFSDAPMCSDAGVTKIRYSLTEPDGITMPSSLSGTVDCADTNGANGSVTFGTETVGALEAGAYSVAKFEGLNNASPPKVLYQAATPVSGVFVLPGQLKAYNVELQPTP